MDLGITGRRAAVAGGTSGLGLATAQALAAEGVAVAIGGRDAGKAAEAAASIGAGCVPIVLDVASLDSGRTFVRLAREALGGVDILIANGGGPPTGTFAQAADDDYERALQLNLLSVVGMCKEAVPAMREQHWGRIVAITSIAARQPIPTLILSNAARAGATGFLKTLATEIAPDGVTVNTVQPGFHRTTRVEDVFGDKLAEAAAGVPMKRLGEPSEFGGVVAFLCSELAGFVTGASLHVDGGAYAGLQ